MIIITLNVNIYFVYDLTMMPNVFLNEGKVTTFLFITNR